MTILQIKQSPALHGTTSVPGDKSISHRALILGALAHGTNRISGWLNAGDTRATLYAMRQLGLAITHNDTELIFEGGRLQTSTKEINCDNAGTAMRLLAGLLAGQPFPSVLTGSQQLQQRPMKRITTPLQSMGVQITDTDGKAPLHIQPAKLEGQTYHLSVASAQVKSAILLAAWFAEGETTIIEPGPSRDHTERMLMSMGAELVINGLSTILTIDRPQLQPLNITIPGDISSAAFLIVATLITPHSDIMLNNIGLNPTRTGILDILKKMGGDIEILRQWESGGEPLGDIRVKSSQLHGITIEDDLIVRAIDELPIIAVAATQAKGQTIIKDAAELRVKEVDRIHAMVNNLKAMNVTIKETPDGMNIKGNSKLNGANVDSAGDHRIGMALAIAGLVASGETTVTDASAIDDSFPGFTDHLFKLGAAIE